VQTRQKRDVILILTSPSSGQPWGPECRKYASLLYAGDKNATHEGDHNRHVPAVVLWPPRLSRKIMLSRRSYLAINKASGT
jgi:hypothetical protein